MVGIIEEQHPDRCRLFMQWKQMDWPILVDSLNLLGVAAVPITLAIDERGIVVGKNLRRDAARQLEQVFAESRLRPAPTARAAGPPPAAPDLDGLEREASAGGGAELERYATALMLWGGTSRLGDALRAYEAVLRLGAATGPTHFRLGVAYRRRYDSSASQPHDFARAVRHWLAARQLDPNQYIWRRRIQQYGPRLDKPYPFYDWVGKARRDIRARGEEPVRLRVEPTGAELAQPQSAFAPVPAAGAAPDPQGRIDRDAGQLVTVEVTAVPPAVVPGEAVRIHVDFQPNAARKAHWNNEAGAFQFWIDPPSGWQADRRLITVAKAAAAVSRETRALEFELRPAAGVAAGRVRVAAYAVYNVCEDVGGTCLYRRQDVLIPIDVRPAAP